MKMKEPEQNWQLSVNMISRVHTVPFVLHIILEIMTIMGLLLSHIILEHITRIQTANILMEYRKWYTAQQMTAFLPA